MTSPSNVHETSLIVAGNVRGVGETSASHDVLEEERHTDRRDEHRDARRVAQRAVREPLDRDTEQGGHRHGDEDRGQTGCRA